VTALEHGLCQAVTMRNEMLFELAFKTGRQKLRTSELLLRKA
jgi:hypothetical protein